MATTPAISSAEQPLDKSFTGFAMPWVTGPYASALASLCVSLYEILPEFRSGNIRTLASPFNGLLAAFDLAISGTIAEST